MQAADSVYVNGNIYTMQEKDFHAEALAVRGQHLVYVGGNAGAQGYIGTDTVVVDLEGRTVIPGITEGHIHFMSIGTALLEVDAANKSKEAILEDVRMQAENRPHGEWIQGRGWNQETWPDRQYPTKEDLDSVAPNHPVLLRRACGHAFWANSLALSLAGIHQDTPDPVGGEIIRDQDGEVIGILTDTAGNSLEAIVPKYADHKLREALKLAQQELFRYGITSAMDAGAGITSAMGAGSTMQTIDLMKDMYKTGELKVRLAAYIPYGPEIQTYYQNGPESGLFDGRLSLRGMKLFSDGSLGARSAWMLDDYSDRPTHRGNGRYSDEELHELMREAHQAGFQIAIHCIGDAAIKQALDVFERVVKPEETNHRCRVEHFQVARPEDIRRLADLKMVPSVQFVHVSSDKGMMEDRVGSSRNLGAFAWRSIVGAGAVLANGSDGPVESVNPFHGLYAGVTRKGILDGLPKGGWYPAECLTRYEALKAATLGSSYAQFEEEVKGSLEVGKYADFVVIDKDYMTCAPDEIKEICALVTVLGGERVYAAYSC